MSSTLLFLGDTYLPRPYKVLLPQKTPYVINLEAPITQHGNPIPEKINLVCRDEFIGRTFGQLPIAVCLANNHIMDYGDQGYEETIKVLHEKNIPFFGAGMPEENFNNPITIKIGDKKIGLFGYCSSELLWQIDKMSLHYSPAPLDFDLIRKNIQTYHDKFDRLVLCLHWGAEESNLPEAEHVRLARKIIDLGVDCIIGHHAHAVQPVERHNNGTIAYGLGNFIFDNLNVPCRFNHTGKPEGFYYKKQRGWNRASIGLNLNFDTMKYTIEYYYFDGKQVVRKKNFYHRYANYKIPQHLNKLEYEVAKHRKRNEILHMVFAFLGENRKIRKLPSWQGIQNAVKLCLKKY